MDLWIIIPSTKFRSCFIIWMWLYYYPIIPPIKLRSCLFIWTVLTSFVIWIVVAPDIITALSPWSVDIPLLLCIIVPVPFVISILLLLSFTVIVLVTTPYHPLHCSSKFCPHLHSNPSPTGRTRDTAYVVTFSTDCGFDFFATFDFVFHCVFNFAF